jgi:tetratricopeptide (TPR) repeat protein
MNEPGVGFSRAPVDSVTARPRLGRKADAKIGRRSNLHRVMEVAAMVGNKKGTRRKADLLAQAQQIIYQAWETVGRDRRLALARKAIGILPDCADAYVPLAEEAGGLDEALELYRQGLEAGERALGKEAFEDEAGNFWLILETRPYMRARAGLARCLWESGRRDEAIAHYRGLLKLNPNDNQGIRYILAACLLELRRDEEVASLLKQYEDDAAAAFAWTGALLAFRRQGDGAEARERLAAALGDESEAVCYAASESPSLRTLRSNQGNSPHLRVHSHVARHRRKPLSGRSRARRGQSLCWQVRRFHSCPTHDGIDSLTGSAGMSGSDRT